MKNVIEAGHFYACAGPTDASMQGWDIGKKLAAEQPSALILFVDDYHNQQSFVLQDETFAGPEAEKQLLDEADHVFYESVFAAQAPQAAKQLLEAGKAKLRGDALSVGGVRLGTFLPDDQGFEPTCAFMDYLLVHQKTELGGDQVAVLPGAYAPEQSQLLVVLGKLAIPALSSYTVKFFDAEGICSEASL